MIRSEIGIGVNGAEMLVTRTYNLKAKRSLISKNRTDTASFTLRSAAT